MSSSSMSSSSINKVPAKSTPSFYHSAVATSATLWNSTISLGSSAMQYYEAIRYPASDDMRAPDTDLKHIPGAFPTAIVEAEEASQSNERIARAQEQCASIIQNPVSVLADIGCLTHNDSMMSADRAIVEKYLPTLQFLTALTEEEVPQLLKRLGIPDALSSTLATQFSETKKSLPRSASFINWLPTTWLSTFAKYCVSDNILRKHLKTPLQEAAGIAANPEATSSRSIQPYELSDKSVHRFAADDLWLLGGQLLQAGSSKYSEQEQFKKIQDSLKQYPKIILTLLEQGTDTDNAKEMLKLSQLPNGILSTINEQLSLFTPYRQDFNKNKSDLLPLFTEKTFFQAVDKIATSQLQTILEKLETTLQKFDPKEMPFIQEFFKELIDSLDLDVMKKVARELCDNYFVKLEDSEMKRNIAVAALQTGFTSSMATKIGAITQHSGPCFQKFIQLYSNEFKDNALVDALQEMKENVKADSPKNVRDCIDENLAREGNPFRDLNLIIKDSDIDSPLKAATINSVHKAMCSGKPMTYTANGMLKTKSHQEQIPVILKIRRTNIVDTIHNEMDELIKSMEQEGPRNTLQEFVNGVLEETDLTNEAENAKLAKIMFTAKAKGGCRIEVPAILAASESMMVQEFAPGKSFESFDKEDYPALSRIDKLHYLENKTYLLSKLQDVWANALVNGHSVLPVGTVSYIEGDRHSGNALYNHQMKTLHLIDFGAGTCLNKNENEGLKAFASSIILGSSSESISALTKIMPKQMQAMPETKKKQLQQDIKTIFADDQPNALRLSKKTLVKFSDKKNEVLLLNTINRIVEKLYEAGVEAPKALIQLKRGAKFIEDQLRYTNIQRAELKAELEKIQIILTGIRDQNTRLHPRVIADELNNIDSMLGNNSETDSLSRIVGLSVDREGGKLNDLTPTSYKNEQEILVRLNEVSRNIRRLKEKDIGASYVFSLVNLKTISGALKVSPAQVGRILSRNLLGDAHHS